MASSLTSVCTATVLVDHQGERGKSGAVKEGSVQRGSNPGAGLLLGYQFHSGLITAVYRFHSVRDRSEKARGHIYIGPPPQLLNNVKVCGPALSSKRSCSEKVAARTCLATTFTSWGGNLPNLAPSDRAGATPGRIHAGCFPPAAAPKYSHVAYHSR
jgi:hypothetical protein